MLAISIYTREPMMNPRPARLIPAVPFLLAFAGNVSAVDVPHVCSWKIETTRSITREVRHFEPGNEPFDLPIAGLPGWKYCRVSEVKQFFSQKYPATRVDIWCVTENGSATNYSEVVSSWSPMTFKSFQLLGAPVSFSGKSDSATVHASGYLDIKLSCLP